MFFSCDPIQMIFYIDPVTGFSGCHCLYFFLLTSELVLCLTMRILSILFKALTSEPDNANIMLQLSSETDYVFLFYTRVIQMFMYAPFSCEAFQNTIWSCQASLNTQLQYLFLSSEPVKIFFIYDPVDGLLESRISF